ncbi:hypothetical protein [Levilactobacillus brevis]|uniref:hypothetical protein n=1 Tax=Levilactobacillus brevis TaxID=1580 RepID=UPI0020CF8F1B|nr:hypothetical protein [Levilactobacillus brevis]MCP9614825.1 hypothetical protein [Levilactobacillus brevis]
MTELNTQTTPIDQATWARREYFYYFTKMMPTGFTLNVDTILQLPKHGSQNTTANLTQPTCTW